MTLPELIDHERGIREEIGQKCIDPTGKADPIYDGVVDPELYLAAPKRILWILKEPWDEDDFSGGDWSLTQLLRDDSLRMARGKTFRPITYITYGIFNRVWKYEDIPGINSEPDMAQLLRSIAFINAKKLPGPRTGSYGPTILEAYRPQRQLIKRQIQAYQPHFIFGCRPHMPEIISDAGIDPANMQITGSAQHVVAGGCAYCCVYHPNQRTISHDRYVNDILGIAASGVV